MGPATQRGGPERDWHHVVEKIHADGTDQFPAERLHSVENMVAVPRGAHQLRDGLTSVFSKKDPEGGDDYGNGFSTSTSPFFGLVLSRDRRRPFRMRRGGTARRQFHLP